MFLKTKFLSNLIVLIALILGTQPPTIPAAQASNLLPTFTISGRVTDEGGSGIQGATILAVQHNYQIFIPLISANSQSAISTPPDPSKNGQNFYTVQTGDNGYYTLSGLPAGRYRLSASKAGADFNPLSYTVSNPGGSNYNFQSTSIPVIYSASANNLGDETLSHLVSISEDGVVYTFDAMTAELSAVGVGEVIIAGDSSAAPQGFLRRVTGIQTNKSGLILTTEAATLEDAFESLSFNVSKKLTPEDAKHIPSTPGIRLLPPSEGQKADQFVFELNNVVVFDKDNNESTTNDRILTSGRLVISPEIDVHARLEGLDVKEFFFKTTWTIESELTVSSAISLVLSKEIELIPTIPLGLVAAGPVAIFPELDLVAVISGEVYAGVSASVSHTTTFTTGMQCIEGDCQNLSKYENDFSFAPLNFDHGVAFKFFVGPKLSFKLYKVLGPYAQAGLALKLDIKPGANPWLALKAGLEASVGFGVEVPIIEMELINISIVAIDKYYTLFELFTTSNNQPNPPANPSPAHWATGQNPILQLSWTGSDPDGDSLVYDIYFNAGSAPPVTRVSNHQSATSYIPGALLPETTYSWKVVAFDEHGLSTEGPVWSFTTIAAINLQPYAPSNPTPANGSVSQSLTSQLSWTGGDPDGDNVVYDVYFNAGGSPATTKVADHQSAITFNPGTLGANATYSWKVVAFDEHGLSTEGAQWSFTTGGGINPGEMVFIPAGDFQMGCDSDNLTESCNPNEQPLHNVYLDAYYIDKYEVTNAQYAQCVATPSSCTPPLYSYSRTHLTYYGDPAYDNFPVIYVNWGQAFLYCQWAGKRLPTEAEWEKAARGSIDTRKYPWGDQVPTCLLANFSTCIGDTTAVGSYPAGISPYGVHDMAGNIIEWVNDWYQEDYYSVSPLVNPPGPTTGTYKITRAGGLGSIDLLRVALRMETHGSLRTDATGFRCADTPDKQP